MAKATSVTKQHNGKSKQKSSGGPPGFGRRRGPMHMMGHDERPEDIKGTVLRIWKYMKHQSTVLIGTVVLVAISSGLGVLGPYLMGEAIDKYIILGDLPGLARLGLLMLGVYLINSLTVWWQSYLMAFVSQHTVRDIRSDLFAKVQTLSLRFFDQRTHGELMSRLTNDVENISNVLSSGMTQLISSVLSIVGVTVMMFVINVRLALVTLVTFPMTVMLSRWIAKRTRKRFREQQEILGDLNGIIEETVTGQRVVKAYVREQGVIEQFETPNRKLQDVASRAQIFAGVTGPIHNFINNVGFAIVAGAGGWMAVQGLGTVGTIASFINYARQFSRPLNHIANLYNMIQSAIAGAERVFETLDEVPELPDVPNAVPLTHIEGDVVFDDVCFGYEEDVPVLKHVNLHAEPGQTIALVGPTGAGKTTIVNLLTRFYDIDSGSIKVDDHDIRKVKKHDLRRKLGIVLQDTFLFTGSVMDNIRYGRLDATDEEVIAAAKLANADQFIRRLPEGYETQLSERGSNLSLEIGRAHV